MTGQLASPENNAPRDGAEIFPALPSQSPTRGAGAVSLLGAAPASVSRSFHEVNNG